MNHLRHLTYLFLVLCLLCLGVFAQETTVEIWDSETGLYVSQEVTLVSLTCDGAPLETDMPAILLDGRTMVPVRIVSENLGGSVSWQEDAQMVIIQQEDTTIQLTIGQPDAWVDGYTVPLYDGVAPVLAKIESGGRTMVPLRFVSEQLGAEIGWDEATYTASIATNKATSGEVGLPVYDGETISLSMSGDCQVFTLDLGDRVVLDFAGGVLQGSSFGQLDLEHPAISAVRYNQYDQGHEGYSRVARVVLDMKEGYAMGDLSLIESDGQYQIVLGDDFEELPQEELVEPEEEDADVPTDEPDITLRPSVMIDPGHGGTEVSATHFGVDEKTVTLPIGLAVGAILEEAGLDVHYTRTEDVKVSLAERVELANDADVDIFVSIHANAYPYNADITGIETFYVYDGENSAVLARFVQNNLIKTTEANNRGTKEAGYYVLMHTLMPAILVETGFLTNEAECQLLDTPEYQQLLAQAIAQGVLDYFTAIPVGG